MTPEEIKLFQQEIRADIKEAVHDELGEYKIPKEQHYIDHVWLKDWRDWQDKTKSTIWKSVIGIGIGVICILLLYGFVFFGRINFGGK